MEEWNIPGRQLPSRRGISAPLRTLTFNINNFRLQSAGFVVFTKCRIIFRKCFLKKSIQHLEKIIRHLVGPEIKEKMPSDRTKRMEKARIGATFSVLAMQRYNNERQNANRPQQTIYLQKRRFVDKSSAAHANDRTTLCYYLQI